MNGIVVVVLVFFALAGGLGAVAYFTYQRKLRRAKAIERGLKMVPILIHLPPPSSDTASGSRDIREVMREKTAQAEVLYNLLAGTATEGFKSNFYGQRHVALELIVTRGLVHFFAAVPVALVSVVKKAVITAYPGARLEETEDHNIFNQEGRLAATLGGEMVLRAESAYPIATYEQLERDPMEALLTTVSALEKEDGVAIQIMLRPAGGGWIKRSLALADSMRKGRSSDLKFTAMDLAKAVVKAPEQKREEERMRSGGGPDVSQLALSQVERIEEKTKHPGFEVLVRVIVSTGSVARSQQLLRDIATTFALFEAPGLNGFKFLPALDVQGLVTAFIFRFFPPELKGNVLSSAELATLFHLPDSQFTPSTSVERQQSKQVDGPVQMPTVGLLFGYNEFRGVKKEIRLSPEDRRRHTYILGQTGTGKSTMLENLAVQDMLSGGGFAFIDPHGDSAEKLLALVPKERAEDVIYFNPADGQYPLGLNLFEFTDPAQKDFLVQETINMLYKLYDPGHTGIIGPRYEHWYRNAALTLMADPNGATFIEVPKVFTDTDYLKQKFKYLKDPTVIDFWTKEMGQTSDYHKSEMLGWFVSKFGAFQNNEIMRNIIGQTKSAFDIREVMDQKKILIVNLSKGRIGELNSQLLGMIFVIKFQAAAMSRADVPEDQRVDFALYVDEFQNFSTDSFASILSEARKYRLNLIVANQFIGQLSNEIRDAVFGNIGTIVAHRMGPEDAEFMTKQFAPVFDASDLVNIPNYNAAMRLMIGGLPSQPFSIHDSAPLGSANAELGMAIKQLSAAKYGHDKAVVEADILNRFSGRSLPAPGAPVPASAAVPPAAPGAPAPAVVPGVAAVSAVAPGVPIVPGVPGVAPTSEVAVGTPTIAAPALVPPMAATPVVPAVASQPALVSAPVPAPVPPMIAPPSSAVALATAVTPGPEPASVPAMGSASASGPLLPPVALTGMAMAPPPIGAPPIGVPPIGAPLVPLATDLVAPAPAAPVVAPEPVPAPASGLAFASAPVSVVTPAPVLVSADASSELAGQIMAARSEPPAPGGLTAPPPIGAPPVDLPGFPPSSKASSASNSVSGTLSLSDITGGSTPGRAPVRTDLDDVPLLGAPTPAPAVEDIQPMVGDGRPLEGDPYSNIDIMGSAAPVTTGGSAEPESEPTLAQAGPSVGDGTPLPNDPYGQIDILGEVAEPADLWPQSVLNQSRPQSSPSLSSQRSEPAIAPAPEPEPMAVSFEPSVPDVALEPDRLASPVAEQRPPVVAEAMRPEPIRTMSPEPPVEPEPREQAPEFVPPEPMPVPAPLPEPEPEAEARPAPVLPMPELKPVVTAPEPAPEPEPVVNEPLIHFVDPAAESLMSRPDEPAEEIDGKPSMSGLPAGVQLVESAAPDAVTPSPQIPVVPAPGAAGANVVPQAQADLAERLNNGTSLSASPAPASLVSPAPMPSTGPPAASPIQTPPPSIGLTDSPAPPDPELQAAREHIAAIMPPPPPTPVPLPEPAPEPESAPTVTPPAPATVSAPEPMVSAQPIAALEPESAPVPTPAPFPAAVPVPEPASIAPEPPKTLLIQPEPAMPASQPSEPSVSQSAPHEEPTEPVADGAAQIQSVEHQIDDLLSVSLIHSDNSAAHHRLPEPVATPKPEDESGVDLELNTGKHSSSTPSKDDHPVAVHHGLKVIQPLEPIVPPKERFAKELAELNHQQVGEVVKPPVRAVQTAPVAAPSVAPPSVVPVKPFTPPPLPPVSEPRPQPKPEPKPAPKPEPKSLAPAAKSVAAWPPAVVSADAAFDEGLPKAESLAADDVAKARIEQAAVIAEPKLPEPPPAAAIVKHEEPMLATEPEYAPRSSDKDESESRTGSKRKRRRGRGSERPVERAEEVEHVESVEEAEHNEPSAADVEVAPLTGKLILPTGDKPVRESEKPRDEKPKKLAPGEVYVDDSGNVMIGE